MSRRTNVLQIPGSRNKKLDQNFKDLDVPRWLATSETCLMQMFEVEALSQPAKRRLNGSEEAHHMLRIDIRVNQVLNKAFHPDHECVVQGLCQLNSVHAFVTAAGMADCSTTLSRADVLLAVLSCI